MVTHATPSGPYFDLQVNGYAGVDFNAPQLSVEQVEMACKQLADDHVGGILATIITADLADMTQRVARVARFVQSSEIVRRVVRGVHVEGPFISDTPGFVGAHPVEHVRRATVDDARRLVDAGEGLVRLMTLAPEHDDGLAVTRHLVGAGVTVSAGHCDPPLAVLRAAAEEGLSMFTHLGNGCAATLDRHDNIIQRALSLSDRLWICLIVDGVHVPWFALNNYLRSATPERCIVVSDAMAAASMGPGSYTLGGMELEVGDDCVARYGDTGYLAGSCITMEASAANLGRRMHLDAATIRRLTWTNPRAAIGLEDDGVEPFAGLGMETNHE
ncbi:MAG: N-acetylglucosamine-6-phosphate deacetylase [Phycisphaera sp.]|nr:N-acetylglucosamine-6-phosphate deacetylase [Phycisphaera sp.]